MTAMCTNCCSEIVLDNYNVSMKEARIKILMPNCKKCIKREVANALSKAHTPKGLQTAILKGMK